MVLFFGKHPPKVLYTHPLEHVHRPQRETNQGLLVVCQPTVEPAQDDPPSGEYKGRLGLPFRNEDCQQKGGN
jgi:hypothetical protein